MSTELGVLAIQIVGWVDDGFPGVVACEFVDADDRTHTMVEKVPVVSLDDLTAASAYPQPGGVRCQVMRRLQDESGKTFAWINLTFPDSVETTEGLVEFRVRNEQVRWIPSGHREPIQQGVWAWVENN